MFCAGLASAQVATVEHRLSVRLDPSARTLEVRDEVRGSFGAAVHFLLHAGLDPRCVTDGTTIERLPQPDLARHGINGGLAVEVEEFRVSSNDGKAIERFELRYGGEIHHPIESGGEEYARSFSGSPGLIDPRGVVLSASTAWYPLVATPDAEDDWLVTFELAVLLPEGWRSVSQGSRAETAGLGDLNFDRWSCPDPMDDIYLIAAEFMEFSRPAGGVSAMAFLRRPDPNLAAKYLETTAQYLDLYQRLIGPYPYTKFALVENFWETGYGMPSFTLLGPKIIRFPFILHSSFPHEILHNWWGNSVFVDYGTGNWCEGLTAYMADHLVKEGQGRGVEYRRDALDRFSAYVNEGRDFPLSEFRSRHSSATEAVGYGKCLMLFHMLRREVGEDRFRLGLARFNRDFAGRRASFQDIAATFTELMGRDYAPFFDQWVKRAGAPSLALDVSDAGVVLRQTQPGEPFTLRVPLALTYEGREEAEWRVIELSDRSVTVPVERSGLVRIDVDPQFDVFRRLDPSETPPTFGRLFGDPRVTIIVPGEDALLGEGAAAGWRTFAESWSRTSSEESQVRVVEADALAEWPTEGSVWVLGATNRWADRFRPALESYGAAFDLRTDAEARLDFGVAQVATADHCFAVATRPTPDSERTYGWIGATRLDSLPGLARKLPHYGKYSFLAFSGSDPTNDAKGQWPAKGSPLIWQRTDASAMAALPARKPLGRLAPVFRPEQLRAHVDHLASDELEGRGVGTEGLDRAAEYVAQQFEAIGLEPGGVDGGYFEPFTVPGGPGGKTAALRNVIAVLPGSDPDWSDQCVVVGAHYDHLGYGWPGGREGEVGKVHNGADDNASGVAVLLEVARLLKETHQPRRSLVFVAFSGEEWGRKGSRYFVGKDHPPFTRDGILGMINLDSVGRLEGRKLMVLGAGSAYEWPHIAMGIGFTTGVESNAVMDELGASDHQSFQEVGVPAIHLFGGPHEDFHRSTDDSVKLDLDGMVKAATWTREALVYLTEREERLKSQLRKQPNRDDDSSAEGSSSEPAGERRVSLGVMPDYRFRGPGVRVERSLPNTPAKRAGIRAGDVLMSIDGNSLKDLRAYSDLLRRYSPGDAVKISLERDGSRLEVETTFQAK